MANAQESFDDAPILHQIDWPVLGDVEGIAESIHERIRIERGDMKPTVDSETRLAETVDTHINRIIENSAAYGVSSAVTARLTQDASYRQSVALAARVRASAFWPLSRAMFMLPGVEEVQCRNHREWLVLYRGNKAMLTPQTTPFTSDDQVVSLFSEIVSMDGITGSTRFDDSHPLAECVVGTLMRLSCAKYPVVSGQSRVMGAVRIPKVGEVSTLEQYVQDGSFPASIAHVLTVFLNRHINILIAGGTGTGKTTLLRVLCGLIRESETVCVIEQGAELALDSTRPVRDERGNLVQKPWVRVVHSLATVPSVLGGIKTENISLGDLVRASLRYTPDRIILGEARGAEACDCCEAMNTGHDGSMMTVHADSADLAVERMKTLVMKHPDINANEALAERIVFNAIEVVVHLKRSRDGRRRLTGIMALDRGGNKTWIYREDRQGVLLRSIREVQDIDRLIERLDGAFLNNEFPEV